MSYPGFLIRKHRLQKNWCLESLGQNICTTSYLSKIERGEVQPSQEIIGLLLAKLGLSWFSPEPQDQTIIGETWEALLSWDPTFPAPLAPDRHRWYEFTPLGLDYLLLQAHATQGAPLDEALEPSMNPQQLALQRLLQNRPEEAAALLPCGFTALQAGMSHYQAGNLPHALEWLQRAYDLGAQEGYPWLLCTAQVMMGNCYAYGQQLQAMDRHYTIASRLAKALRNQDLLISMGYNRAATQMELGQYDKALGFFETLEKPDQLSLHKLAICYEQLGRPEEARSALERAETVPPDPQLPAGAVKQMLALVRCRLEHPAYLEEEAYGTQLLELFRLCQEQLPAGFGRFHLPWVLEWYQAHRQYKQMVELLQAFPGTVPHCPF